MRRYVFVALAIMVLVGAGAAWWLSMSVDTPTTAPQDGSPNGTGRVLYYQDPSGAPAYSAVPRKDGTGRDYTAIRAIEAGTQAARSPTAQTGGRKVLYYRNPMGLADTSPVPKKDSMGMDYIPVYEDEVRDEPGTVRIGIDKVQRLGVRTSEVTRRVLNESVVLSGTVTADERRQSVVGLKFKAWISKLHVAATGATVKAGQPLFDIQSPFILQQETTLAIALNAKDASQELGDVYARTNARSEASARQRLRLYEVPEREIQRLVRTRQPSGNITWYATHGGTVTEKAAVVGMQADEGAPLYRIVDLSSVWVIAEAPESSLAIARPGATARISLNALPGKTYTGAVTFVYPEVSITTRTAKVRVELANPDSVLIPGMFASVEIVAPPGESVLAVPDSALIDSGTRQVVLVAREEGLFEPRAVRVGRRAAGMVEIKAGLKENEKVVSAATFLIDAESNLRAALQGFTAGDAPKEPTQ